MRKDPDGVVDDSIGLRCEDCEYCDSCDGCEGCKDCTYCFGLIDESGQTFRVYDKQYANHDVWLAASKRAVQP